MLFTQNIVTKPPSPFTLDFLNRHVSYETYYFVSESMRMFLTLSYQIVSKYFLISTVQLRWNGDSRQKNAF